jgi:transcriptional regulator with XRE-family HTH domain
MSSPKQSRKRAEPRHQALQQLLDRANASDTPSAPESRLLDALEQIATALVGFSESAGDEDDRPDADKTPEPALEVEGTVAMNVAENVRAMRRQADWTQNELADAMKALGFAWKRLTCTEVERGTRRLSVEELLAIAAIFRIPAIEVLVPPYPGMGTELPTILLSPEDLRELFLGEGSKVGTASMSWDVSERVLRSGNGQVPSPDAGLWVEEKLNEAEWAHRRYGKRASKSYRADQAGDGPKSGSPRR